MLGVWQRPSGVPDLFWSLFLEIPKLCYNAWLYYNAGVELSFGLIFSCAGKKLFDAGSLL
eukprot:112618-Pyramimonas_sp.AAC.1